MQHRKFGTASGDVAIIGQGTWRLDDDDRRSAVAALQRGIDQGMTHIDTAEMYGDSELVVADAIGGRKRDELFIVSKVLPNNASRAAVIAACERSLKRLGTDRLECYLLHWRGGTPLEDTIDGFEHLVGAGKILSWGVSNFDVDDLDDAISVAGPGRIACNQVLYHLKNRTIEHGVLPWCERHRVALVAYSPFGCGDFPSADSAGGRVLADIAGARGVTAHAVALAFLCRREAVFSIPKSSDPERVTANCAAGALALTADEIARIEKSFPLGNWRGLPSL
jgi:diketogulonate reductase-like aldo/keto reductase